eukprot:642274-Pleurochrysis_carterae.AAC.1
MQFVRTPRRIPPAQLADVFCRNEDEKLAYDLTRRSTRRRTSRSEDLRPIVWRSREKGSAHDEKRGAVSLVRKEIRPRRERCPDRARLA